MAFFTSLNIYTANLSALTLITFAIPFTILLILLTTRIYTTITYRLAIHHFSTSKSKEATPSPPPRLPYSIPLLGHGISWLSTKPGSFFRTIQSSLAPYPHIGAITIVLAGQAAHLLNSPELVSKLFKTKGVSRTRFNHDVMVRSMGLEEADDRKLYGGMRDGVEGGKEWERRNHEINAEFLLNQNAVNALTSKFMEVFMLELREGGHGREIEVPLYEFLRGRMLRASTTALYGRDIVKMNPDMDQLYWDFDAGVLPSLFGLSAWMSPAPYKSGALRRILDRWEQWEKVVRERYGDEVPEGMEWDEMVGAKVIRQRHRLYALFGLSDRGFASADLGYLFGLSSNAIPATTWVLFHLLASPSSKLLAEVQREVESARQSNGTVDVNVLTGLPYLNSVFHETLRVHVDTLVTRTLNEDLTLDQYRMKKGDIIIAPSWLGHHNAEAWREDSMPPEDLWYGERFLRTDEKTGRATFTTAGLAGRFFPFGGGPSACPGRVFAKQEILGAVATVLLTFEVQFVEYLRFDKAGKPLRKGVQADGFPITAKQFSGNSVVIPEGDMMVKLTRRKTG